MTADHQTASSGPGSAGLQRAFGRWSGRVVAFDEHAGLGEVELAEQSLRLPFHATRIADGTRSIEVDAAVAFDVAPGPLGMEASNLAPK